MSRRLERAFFDRPAEEVAPDLLGQVLVRVLPSGARLSIRIVETEAYGPGDPASHAFRGPTPRTAVMFGPAGHLYVYFVYGMHWCANVVTGPSGVASAVLLRAGEPLEGLGEMGVNRAGRTPLATGPARLTQALAITGADNGLDIITSSACWIEGSRGSRPNSITTGRRIGVGKGAETPWRFWESGSTFVSGARALSGKAAPAAQ
jgi:DNA-3-methyladenine glycosylase